MSSGPIEVTVSYGAGNSVTVRAEGNGDTPARISEVLAEVQDQLGIPTGCTVSRNGMTVDLEEPVNDGDRITVIAPAGRKG